MLRCRLQKVVFDVMGTLLCVSCEAVRVGLKLMRCLVGMALDICSWDNMLKHSTKHFQAPSKLFGDLSRPC